jgi:hypothetical protein
MTVQVNSLEVKIASYLSERYVQESEPHGGVMLQREILVGKKAVENEQKKKKKRKRDWIVIMIYLPFGRKISWKCSTLVPFERFCIAIQ